MVQTERYSHVYSARTELCHSTLIDDLSSEVAISYHAFTMLCHGIIERYIHAHAWYIMVQTERYSHVHPARTELRYYAWVDDLSSKVAVSFYFYILCHGTTERYIHAHPRYRQKGVATYIQREMNYVRHCAWIDELSSKVAVSFHFYHALPWYNRKIYPRSFMVHTERYSRWSDIFRMAVWLEL